MTDHNKLAQRIVAQGVGNHIPGIAIDEYRLGESTYMTAEQFCQDGRVVLAVMEKCYLIQVTETTTKGWYVVARSKGGKYGYGDATEGGITIAILEAGLSALEGDDE